MYNFKVKEVFRTRRLTKFAYEMYVEWPEKPEPGTFFMVWLPGFEAIPLSVAGWSRGTLKFLIEIRGPTTKALFWATKVGLMGPLGKPAPKPVSRPTLVAGGIGIAPLLYMWEEWGGKILYGAKSKDRLIPVDGVEVITEDDSAGREGKVTDLLVESGAKSDIYACGPYQMVKVIGEMARRKGLRGYASTERPVKCAMGICGACTISGRLLCKEPWIPLTEL